MERDQFVDIDNQGWWLLEPELDSTLMARRDALGEAFGWSDRQWYTDRYNVEELYQFIESNQRDLLRELDEDLNLDRRCLWIDQLIEARTPPQAEQEEEKSPPESRGDGATADEASPAATPEAPPARRGLFARKSEPQAAATEDAETGDAGAGAASPAGTAAEAEAASAGDGGVAQGEPEPSRSSLFAKRPRAAENTAEAGPVTVEAKTSEAETGESEPEGTETAVAAEDATSPSSEELRDSLAQLAADPAASIETADVEKILKDPHFEETLAQAAADIESELEGLEDEDWEDEEEVLEEAEV